MVKYSVTGSSIADSISLATPAKLKALMSPYSLSSRIASIAKYGYSVFSIFSFIIILAIAKVTSENFSIFIRQIIIAR
jgi:hypothetical protein